jgi:hypothetical protein
MEPCSICNVDSTVAVAHGGQCSNASQQPGSLPRVQSAVSGNQSLAWSHVLVCWFHLTTRRPKLCGVVELPETSMLNTIWKTGKTHIFSMNEVLIAILLSPQKRFHKLLFFV